MTLARYGTRRLLLAQAGLTTPQLAARHTVNLLPVPVDLELYRGDDAVFNLAVTDAGQPADLSGADPLAQIRATPDGDVMAQFDTSIAGNVLTLHLTHAVAATLTVGRGVWDCQITQAGVVTTLAAGTVTIRAEVSW